MNEEKDGSTITSTQKSTFKKIAKEIVSFGLIILAVILFRIYVAEPYLVDGRSMYPTFETGDYLIVDKISYNFTEPKRDSVIIFKYPKDTKRSFIKRIIGLPGETVSLRQGKLTIINKENPDGFVINEPYVEYKSEETLTVTLKDDEYFVMGDNRKESFDSRIWGPLNKKYMLGRPVLRLFTVSETRWFGIPGISFKFTGILPGNN